MPDPRTHAVGRLVLLYTDGSQMYQTSVGLQIGADPFNEATMETKADVWAGLLAPLLSPVFSITHWKSLDTNLVEALSMPFGAAHDGSSGTDSGEHPYKSLTACITGMTQVPTATNRIKQTRQFIYLRNTIAIAEGQKEFSKFISTAWSDYVDFLTDDDVIWSDVQGRNARARSSIKVQWNSFIQKQLGS